ncbi:MAG TPA: 50S ribosomal protein L10 [Anaerolineales bacterium]|nr:50S ribosomal protein L10 [Anaerolineales bacterium]
MAISKERKQELVEEYKDWLSKSRAVILTEYEGLSMKDLDNLRAKVREAGAEFHIIKNTLGKIAFEQSERPLPEGYFEGTTAAGFAFEDAPALAKALTDFSKTAETLKIKGGYLAVAPMSAEEIIALAELPPLPVMRARLLGTIMAPASQLTRMLNEPARQVVTVFKAYADKEPAESAA